MAIRPLTHQDKAAIASVLGSRSGLTTVGVSWTLDSVLTELSTSPSLGYLNESRLESFILFKDMGSVLEIILIYSRKGAHGAAEHVLRALVDAYSQSKEIWLEVHEENASAIRFYQSQGFVKVSRRSNYYSDGKAALNYNLALQR